MASRATPVYGPVRPRFHVLGSPGLTAAAGQDPEAILRQPKRTAFLAFLLLDRPGDFLARDRLLGTFWPEADAARAQASLRQSLAFLRASLGAGILESRGQHAVRVVPGSIWCDALRLERLLDRSEAVTALELYRGDLLAGLHVRGTPAFDQWVSDRRRRLRDRVAEGAVGLAREAVGRRDHAEAVHWGRWAADVLPHDERHVRMVMEVLRDAGDRSGALRAWQRLRAHLEEEIGVRAAPETLALVRSVRARPRDPALLAETARRGRRSGADRRGGERRVATDPAPGRERRSGRDRREDQRRSGRERRGPTDGAVAEPLEAPDLDSEHPPS